MSHESRKLVVNELWFCRAGLLLVLDEFCVVKKQ